MPPTRVSAPAAPPSAPVPRAAPTRAAGPAFAELMRAAPDPVAPPRQDVAGSGTGLPAADGAAAKPPEAAKAKAAAAEPSGTCADTPPGSTPLPRAVRGKADAAPTRARAAKSDVADAAGPLLAPTDPLAPAIAPFATDAPNGGPVPPPPSEAEPAAANAPVLTVQLAGQGVEPGGLTPIAATAPLMVGGKPDPLTTGPAGIASKAAEALAAPSEAAVTSAPPLVPAVPLLATSAPAPAGQVFAAALHLAASSDERRARRETDAIALSAPETTRSTTVETATDPAPIDLADRQSPARMAERIEGLRDAAEDTSTRVRVSPDALGPVELHVRHQAGELHVRLDAADPAARALLKEAQPELARLVAERGLKLGQSSVGDGGGDSPRRSLPRAPARFAPVAAAEAAEPITDRIA